MAESGDELNSAEEVMKAADKALYKAKNRGRNQVSRQQPVGLKSFP